MAMRGRICLLLFCFLLVSAASVLGKTFEVDEENLHKETPWERLGECESRCQEQRREGQQEQYQRCQQKCFDKFKQEQEKGQGGRDNDPREDPEKAKRECQDKCREKYTKRDDRERCEWKHCWGRRPREDPEKAKRECQDKCREEYTKRDDRERCEWKHCWGRSPREDPEKAKRECQDKCREKYTKRDDRERCEWKHCWGRSPREDPEREQEQETGEKSPYVFQDEHFTSQLRTEHGMLKILQKFSKRSEVLRGIDNFRVAMLEADPQTFVVPNHVDADVLFFVTQGKGTLSLVRPEKRESFNIKQGDVVRIPAGITAYIINRDNNQKLVLAKLIRPISTPGSFEAFYMAGRDNPESLLKAFSTEVLEAAFNTKKDRLQRIFGQQQGQGVIIKASKEQIRALSQHEESGHWLFGGEPRGAFNLLEKPPLSSNQYGSIHRVEANELRQLEDLDVAISFVNITQGSMAGPLYHSKSTKIAVVTNGEGYFEMACPHLTSQESDNKGWTSTKSYTKVSSRLRRGVVFVMPAGHPVAVMASINQNLELVGFEVNAKNDETFPLAGKRNVVNQLESEAMELAFGVSSRQVKEVFSSQEEELFFKGPRQQGRAEM